MNWKGLLVSLSLMTFMLSLQAQPYLLKLTYDATKGFGDLEGQPSIYMHSGAVLNLGDDDPFWFNVVGNWGLDDGVGRLDSVPDSTDLWTITLDLPDYYGYALMDSVPIIGVVFREPGPCGTENGFPECLEGKDYNNENVFITGISDFNPQAKQTEGTNFDGVTLEWIGGVPNSIFDAEFDSEFTAFPNPFVTESTVNMTSGKVYENVDVYLVNQLGQRIKSLYNGRLDSGTQRFDIDGTDVNGNELACGMYWVVAENEAYRSTLRLIKTN